MGEILQAVLRTIGAVALILLLERMLGRRTMAKMNYRDFVGATMAGTIAANMAFNLKIGLWVFLFSLAVLGVTLIAITRVELKSRRVRKLLEGEPVIVVEQGRILHERLEEQKMNEELLMQELRLKDIFDVGQVEKALIERNGKITVRKKKEYLAATFGDLQHNPGSGSPYPMELIRDGEILQDGLRTQGLDAEWLQAEMADRGLTAQEVRYAVRASDGELYFFSDRALGQP